MRLRFITATVILGAGLTLSLGVPSGNCRSAAAGSAAVGTQEPDNTRANQNQNPTADQQKETPADRELAQKIRKAIVDDGSLSTYAHNVKIIVRNGVVVLKGPVQSVQERKTVAAKAEEIAGTGKVKNQLTVKS